MTPEQQAAIESAAGRALTAGELVAIDSLLAARNDVQIAAIISAGRVRVVSHLIGERGILDVLGPVAGDAFLTALEAIVTADNLPAALQPYFGAIRRGVAWLKTDGLDVGSATTRSLLDSLAAAGIVAPESVASIKALAERPDPINYNHVSDALNIAEGRMTLEG